MFSNEQKKQARRDIFNKPTNELISIREIYLNDKFDKRGDNIKNEGLPSSSSRTELDASRSPFRDGFFPESLEQQQASFAWTEEDGNIASMVSEPGFGTTGQTSFGKDLDATLKSEMKEADTSTLFSTSSSNSHYIVKPFADSHHVTSTYTSGESSVAPHKISATGMKDGQDGYKMEKGGPFTKLHLIQQMGKEGRYIKLWECGICHREFKYHYTLMRHLPTHTDERNYHCNVCGKSFRQLSTLSQHRAIHSPDRPYICEVCNKAFNRVSTLISHRKTHSGDKPYKCHLCPKGFHQKGNLRNHVFTHTNERPYRCNICNKGFNQQSNLVCHKNKAHPDASSNSSRDGNTPRVMTPTKEVQEPELTKPSTQQCQVSSTVGPITRPSENRYNWPFNMDHEPHFQPEDYWANDAPLGNGVIVDPIKTYHMGVALATNQTPFALLKADNKTPVLVKVVDTNLPGGKQMLVPATAEDLRIGGKIIVKSEDNSSPQSDAEEGGNAVQIRVPVVATVVPRIGDGGRLHLAVEEPHRAYHTAISSDVGDVRVSTSNELPHSNQHPSFCMKYEGNAAGPSAGVSWMCELPPPTPFPPLDLFESSEYMSAGPQATPVEPPLSDDESL